MELQEALSILDDIDKGGPDAVSPSGETSYEVMSSVASIPGAADEFVRRYGSSNNEITVSNVAGLLVDLAEKPTVATANLVYELASQMSNLDDPWTMNNLLLAIRTQAIYGMPWAGDTQPQAFSTVLLHALGMEADNQFDNADTAVNILWNVHNWAEDRGGIRSVLSPEERQAFRDKFDEAGLEPGPILEALGED